MNSLECNYINLNQDFTGNKWEVQVLLEEGLQQQLTNKLNPRDVLDYVQGNDL